MTQMVRYVLLESMTTMFIIGKCIKSPHKDISVGNQCVISKTIMTDNRKNEEKTDIEKQN